MSNNSESSSSLQQQQQTKYYLQLNTITSQPDIPLDSTITCEKNTILHIAIPNGSKITKHIYLITNANEDFPIELVQNSQNAINSSLPLPDTLSKYKHPPTEQSTSIIFEVNLNRSGSFTFLFLYTNETTNLPSLTQEFYIIVNPNIMLYDRPISIKQISIQTILSKSLGKIHNFDKIYKELKQLNYNFVHFTPIQKLGVSESLYCLRDNTQINNVFFDKGESMTNEEKVLKFKESLASLRNDYGIGSIVDIVLNHAADNSEWLSDHPDCGYNLVNCPWLNSAYELDKVFNDFAKRFASGKTRFKCAPYVNNEQDLNDIMGEIFKEINMKNLHEYFIINIAKIKEELIKYYNEKDSQSHKEEYNIISNTDAFKRVNNEGSAYDYFLTNCLDSFGQERNGVTLIISNAYYSLMKICKDKNELLTKAEKFCNQCNNQWINSIKSYINIAIDNVKNGIRYQFIQCKKSTNKEPLIWPYFAVFDENDKSKIFACNGWIMESEDKNDPTPNFTKKGSYYYFKRKVMIWSDCPKINYGTSISTCCPYLLEHMTKYVQDMATIFNGFRLDNAHSTPIYIGEYLTMKAREVNPDLLVIAELFTTKENEIRFVNRIGINLLIRELIWCGNAGELSKQLHRFGGGKEEMLGKVKESVYDYNKDENSGKGVTVKYKALVPHLPYSVIFDLTHDNETYYQKFNNLPLNLTKMACNSLCASGIGSTRGFDQLFPIQPSVVNESREYDYDQEFDSICQKEEPEPKIESTIETMVEEKPEPEEIKVTFDLKASNVQSVALAINSNNWKPDIMLEKSGHDYWKKDLILPKGRYYYKFVLNSSNWLHDSSKPNEKDSSGNINNYIDIGIQSNSHHNNTIQPIVSNSKQSYHIEDLKIFRRELNKARNFLSLYPNEIFLHQEGNYLTIFRSFISTINYLKNSTLNYDGYALICHTGYDTKSSQSTRIELPGIYSEFVCGASMRSGNINIDTFKANKKLIGTKSDCYLTKDPSYLNSFSKMSIINNKSIIDINNNMQPNTAILIKFKLPNNLRNNLLKLEESLKYLHEKGDEELLTKITMCDINLILFKCETEEKDNTNQKRGNYKIDTWNTFVYAGLSHLYQMLQKIKHSRDNHPILDHIRKGDWLLEYSINRYCDQTNLRNLYDFLMKNIYSAYVSLYEYQKPYYFIEIIDALYHMIHRKIACITTNSSLVRFSSFGRQLLSAVYQFNGYIESSRFKHVFYDKELNKLSMSAGLPHFSSEYMRCWGRDTFIAYKGLLLIPGYYNEAKEILMSYASTMRHGLIPNLLDSGVNSRYNARDATWFFLQSIADYVNLSNDYQILNSKIPLISLDDDYNTHNSKLSRNENKSMVLSNLIQHILQCHVNGIAFREWRAGKQIDEQMKDEGFNINIYFNETNGFIYGGNKMNCGTWMDKMGSSEKAKNKGTPATPRNGANVEIIGLLYSVLRFITKMNSEGKYEYSSVKMKSGTELLYVKWMELLKNNFDSCFYISNKNDYTNKIGMYRDYLCDDGDYRHECQLRPNYLIAMAVAPEMFDEKHALKGIEIAEKYLCVDNCIGIRTLDYEDKNYNGNYILNDDGVNYHCAHGFNYHNGPEWIWPMGYYFIAKMNFGKEDEKVIRDVYKRLIPFEKYIREDAWSGLPELTNKDGAICLGSCTTQAWSIGTILEAVDMLSHLMKH